MSDEQFFGLFCIGIIVFFVGLFAGIPLGIQYSQGAVVGKIPYQAQGGPARILTIRTPSGNINATVTCTYYDNATGFPIVGSTFTWYVWHYGNPSWGPDLQHLPRGC